MLYAKDGKEALDIYHNNKNKIDAALIDIQMPEINGLEVAKAIRKEDKTLPLIAQTGLALNIGKGDAEEAGFNDIIYKPIKFDLMVTLLKKYLG